MKMLARPHTRFCQANASANTSRPQPCASPIGCMNNPKVERVPMAINTTNAPRATVRSDNDEDAGSVAVDMAGLGGQVNAG